MFHFSNARWATPIALVTCALTAWASSPAGEYEGHVSGLKAELTLVSQGQQVMGRLAIGQYTFLVQGRTTSDGFTASLTPVSGGRPGQFKQGAFKAQQRGDLLVIDATGLEPDAVRFPMVRTTKAATNSGQPTPPAAPAMQANPYAGVYTANMEGTPVRLSVQQHGSSMTARLVDDEGDYRLRPRMENGRLVGSFHTGETYFRYTAELKGRDHLQMKLILSQAGVQAVVPITFVRGNQMPGAQRVTADVAGQRVNLSEQPGWREQPAPRRQPQWQPPQRRPQAQPRPRYQANSQLDPRLVGMWRRTVSGGTNAGGGSLQTATDMVCQLHANGTYVEYAQSAGSWRNDGSGTVETGRNVTRGKWKVSAGHLYYTYGNGPWQDWGRYHVDQRNLLITFSNGGQVLWER